MSQQMRQQMVLAPQLRQSLEMLQLPVLELRAMIQQEMERNPLLDDLRTNDVSIEAEREAQTSEDRRAEPEFGEHGPDQPDYGPEGGEDRNEEMDFDREFEALTQLDDEWRDYFYQDGGSQEYTEDAEEKRQFMLDCIVQTESLQEHLLTQLELTELDASDRQIAELVIGSLDDAGYLRTPLADIAQSSSTDIARVEVALAAVQDMTPSGIGARDLRECLLIQLRHLQREDSLATRLVRSHLELVAAHRLAQTAAACNAPLEDVKAAIDELSRLDPKPGLSFASEQSTYVVPEMEVRLVDGRYLVFVDDTQLPHVRISRHYRRLLEDPATTAETKSYIRERIRAGMFLIKSIYQRQRTIQRIATEIVDAQQAFFAEGVSALRPLTMADIAVKVGVHETTVSRTVSGKYMRTPRGVIELRFFFTHGVKTADGGSISNKTVQDKINQMVAAEDTAHPYSDQELQAKLKAAGIDVARRTVAKYRIQLKIPPSHQRRRG
jgi:RNA polymerase sigma-54 factor